MGYRSRAHQKWGIGNYINRANPPQYLAPGLQRGARRILRQVHIVTGAKNRRVPCNLAYNFR